MFQVRSRTETHLEFRVTVWCVSNMVLVANAILEGQFWTLFIIASDHHLCPPTPRSSKCHLGLTLIPWLGRILWVGISVVCV